jgi:hypothetical protein
MCYNHLKTSIVYNCMSNKSVAVKPEWTMAILDVVRILVNRGYLHRPEDVAIERQQHEPVFPCGKGGDEGPLKFNQLEACVKMGRFYFDWYVGSFLSLKLKKGLLEQELVLDPTTQNIWEFIREVDDNFK